MNRRNDSFHSCSLSSVCFHILCYRNFYFSFCVCVCFSAFSFKPPLSTRLWFLGLCYQHGIYCFIEAAGNFVVNESFDVIPFPLKSSESSFGILFYLHFRLHFITLVQSRFDCRRRCGRGGIVNGECHTLSVLKFSFRWERVCVCVSLFVCRFSLFFSILIIFISFIFY